MTSRQRDFQCFCDALYVADRENFPLHRVSRPLIALIGQSRCVVRPDWPSETDLVVDSEHISHVGRTVVGERLAEAFASTLDVAQVNEEYLILPAELSDKRSDVVPHELEVGLAKSDAVDRAWDDVKNPAVQKMIAIADAGNRDAKLRENSYAATITSVIVAAEVMNRAVNEVGWDKFDGQAVYNQLIKLKDFAPLGGLNYWTFTEQIRSIGTTYMCQIQGGKIMPIEPWCTIPDLRPGGPWTP